MATITVRGLDDLLHARLKQRAREIDDAKARAAMHGATLATRNVKDFVDCGIDLVNPWEATD